MTRLSTFVCMSIAYLSLAVVTKADQEPAQARAVQERVASYVSAFNHHDAGALARHWTEQAEYIHPVTGGRIQGRQAIKKAFDELVARYKGRLFSFILRMVKDPTLAEAHLRLGQLSNDDGYFMRWADNRLMRRMIRDSWNRNLQPAETYSTLIENGSFQFSGEITEPRLYYLFIEGARGAIPLILEAGEERHEG